eukprot:gnl/TRDRNA2_/TRDRNA2_90365_c0_seq1.p1 gnl/TRDRNA2_/TRDRNA2_90365_c0~~gnl/TRDRNA2_/TRDRNA2_90365_c0_seq1.p1  ORF type:complete len:553 (-),score=53.67 gnl/TRDRNA2_/TRDRNA2_90365_c0_seq1:13-1671(-)
MVPEGRLFVAWARFWGACCLMDVWQQPENWPEPAYLWHIAMLVSTLCLICSPSPLMWSILLCIRNVARVMKMPYIWDSDYWALSLDVAFLMSQVAVYKHAPRDHSVLRAAPAVQALLAMFYFAAGFWKVNSSFLSPRTSCGSIFAVSLLVQVWSESWGQIPVPAARLAVVTGPWLTVIGESVTGLILAIPGRSSKLLGLSSMILLHLGISFTASPNGIANFSYTAATRYYFLVPYGASQAVDELLSVPKSAAGLAGRAAFAICLALAWHCGQVAGPQHAGAVFFAAMACIYVRAMQVEMAEPSLPQPYRLGPLFKMYLALVSFFVFGAQVLGLSDLSAPASPFSSLRVHGGSNHLILPTGLLQNWAGDSIESAGSFEGGIVRVEYSDSDWLNSLYPAECTVLIPPKIVTVLRQGGHLGRQFHPTPHRVLGPAVRATLPHWRPGDGPFPQYTVPAMELRRMITELRASGEDNFSLVYVRLPGIHGDDAWRATAMGPRVEFNISGGIEHCLSDGKPCNNELVQLPELDYVSWKTRVFFPHPIVDGSEGELPCLD